MRVDLVVAEPQGDGPGVFLHMGRVGGLGDCENRSPARQEGERHLPRRGAVGGGDLAEHTPAAVPGPGKSP